MSALFGEDTSPEAEAARGELDPPGRQAEGRPLPSPTKSRIMYVEYKGEGLAGPATISRVTFSKTGRTVYYRGRSLQSLNGSGYKATHFDAETGECYWVSGPRKDGFDPLYPAVVEIDEDVREEYWTTIRGRPESVAQTSFRTNGKHPRRAHENGRRLR